MAYARQTSAFDVFVVTVVNSGWEISEFIKLDAI